MSSREESVQDTAAGLLQVTWMPQGLAESASVRVYTLATRKLVSYEEEKVHACKRRPQCP